MRENISLLLLMGGKGKRFSDSTPKQFQYLSGKKLYLHTLDFFYNLKIFKKIILPCCKEYISEVKKETKHYEDLFIIEGGSTRQTSTYNSLKFLKKDKIEYVMIHDIVRPFVSEKIILENIENVKKYKAVDTCISSYDTLVEKDSLDFIKNIPDRKKILRGQTPQTFNFELIYNAHKKAIKNRFFDSTDDCQLVINDTKIRIIEGDELNIKITTKLDLYLAEQILRLKHDKISTGNNSLKNKIYAVIGANGGIGTQIVNELKNEGSAVLEISRNSFYKTDITNYQNVKKTFEDIFLKYGKIDGIINAAGILIVKPFLSFNNDEIDSIIKTNLLGLIYCCREAKIKDGGDIVNISSSSYSYGRKDFGIYSSSKSAVVNFTQSLALELTNLKVNTIVPQRTNTQMRQLFFKNEENLLSPNVVAKEIIKILKQNFTGNIFEIKI